MAEKRLNRVGRRTSCLLIDIWCHNHYDINVVRILLGSDETTIKPESNRVQLASYCRPPSQVTLPYNPAPLREQEDTLNLLLCTN